MHNIREYYYNFKIFNLIDPAFTKYNSCLKGSLKFAKSDVSIKAKWNFLIINFQLKHILKKLWIQYKCWPNRLNLGSLKSKTTKFDFIKRKPSSVLLTKLTKSQLELLRLRVTEQF